MSDSFKKYFANTSWLFGEKVIRLVISFIVQIYITNYLGTERFGLLSYVISFVGIFGTISTFGMDSILTRQLIKEPEKRDDLLGTVFYLRVFGAVASIAAVYLALKLIGDDRETVILALIVALTPLFQSFYIIEFYFQSKVQAKYSSTVYLAGLIIASVLRVILIITGSPLIYFAVITSAEFLITGIGFIIIYQVNKLDIFNWRFSRGLARLLLNDSWPLILSSVAVAVYMKIGQLLIKHMMSNHDNGIYAAAVRLCEAWYFIPMAVASSLFPAIINAKSSSEELYKSRMQKLYDLLALIAIAIALPVTFFSEFIMEIYRPEFIPGAPVLTIYIWTGVAVFLGVASSQYLIAENLTKLSFYRTLIGMVLNIVLNILLIPVWGIKGSAVATLVSQFVSTLSIGIGKKTSSQLVMMLKSIFLVNIIKTAYSYVRPGK